MPDRGPQWDDEPIGDLDEGKRRRWRRPWHVYACYLLGFFGVIITFGAATNGSVVHTLAGGCFLLAAVSVVLADGPRAKAGRPPPPPPTPSTELGWYAATAALAVLGALLLST